jgi:uncharacterized heparinase superfamily protein
LVEVDAARHRRAADGLEPDYQSEKAESVIARLRAWLGRTRVTVAAPPAPELPPPPDLRAECDANGIAVGRWIAARPTGGRLYSTLSQASITQLAERWPSQRTATIAAADRVMRHEFDLLGSGAYVPVDPNRPARGGYQPIDWYLDPVKGLRFPERIPHRQWNLLEMRPGLADVKLPWELGRCQHWLPLAQAFRLTGDAQYASEIFEQHDDFMEANPVGLGVNWTCTMDVAIRAFNWAIALELIERGGPTPPECREGMYASLFAHGHFIERNLENKYEVTSNHFLSNVVGLFGMALLFKELPSGARWIARCREWLEQEMRVQVLPDGADYESSVPYHRLVAELFMAGDRLAQCDGAALSLEYRTRLRSMASFLDAVLRPDGRLPQVGDADDGRVHIFSNYGRWEPQDARHLLPPASILFEAPEWWRSDDPWAAWEAAWWGLEPRAEGATPAPVQKLFPDAGLAVFKDRQRYLLVTNGVVGTNGFGNHKHNDLLSFEYHDRGVAVIVDPGSYVYTSNPDARNRFRSTRSHNTLTLDNQEQNEFKTEWLFRMFAKAQPEHVEFLADAVRSRYRGRHDGYTRLPHPVVHERSFELEHASGMLEIADRLTGEGAHTVVWRFHCAPGVTVAIEADGSLTLRSGALAWSLRSLDRLAPSVDESWYSPSYGVRVPAQAIEFRIEQRFSGVHDWTFRLEPQS